MCGIAGFNWGDAALIKKMLDCIRHRGPDEEGSYINKNISLGSRRLSIIDLSRKGRQPIYNEDKSICVVFNGEIYNFQDIKPELESKRHKFYSNTDTEVIVHSYEEYGLKCFEKFNGMFAIAIWDAKKRELILARDRLGKKPLYYCNSGKKFIFASEIKAILKFDITKIINETAVYHYLAYGYTAREESICMSIRKLEPGHALVLKDNSTNINKYWQLDFSKKINNTEDFFAKEILRHLED